MKKVANINTSDRRPKTFLGHFSTKPHTPEQLIGRASGYRNDITGLRAIAVGLILLFHLKIQIISGGFIGVDVFFVISGYLITRSLLQPHKPQSLKQTLLTFYARRVQRLFPALLATITVSVLAGYFILGPSAFDRLAASALAAVFSVSNIYFLFTTGYWAPSSNSLPLLHTWSLGVEEQFYLIWPILILALTSRTKKVLWVGLFILTCLSLLWSIKLSKGFESAAFYLMPIRFFQFAIGAFCVALDDRDWPETKPAHILRHFLFFCGLLAILVSAFKFDADTIFPGSAALVPTLGAAGIILSRAPKYFKGILENPLMHWVGLTSYSIYLVHWPIIVFLQMHFGTLSPKIIGLAIMLTFGLSTLQYYFIESKFRTTKAKSKASTKIPQNVFASTFAILPILGLIWIGIHFSSTLNKDAPSSIGIKNTLIGITTSKVPVTLHTMRHERDVKYSALCRDAKKDHVCGKPSKEKPNVLILGDSHAVQWLNALSFAYPDINFLASSENGCIASNHFKKDPECYPVNTRRFNFLTQNAKDIQALVIGHRHYGNTAKVTRDTAIWAQSLGLKVIVIGPSLELTEPYQDLVERLGNPEALLKNLQKYRDMRPWKNFEPAASHLEKSGIPILDPLAYFCNTQTCALTTDSAIPVLIDAHHISLPASLAYGAYLRENRPHLFTE